jgi:hypothetical protein
MSYCFFFNLTLYNSIRIHTWLPGISARNWQIELSSTKYFNRKVILRLQIQRAKHIVFKIKKFTAVGNLLRVSKISISMSVAETAVSLPYHYPITPITSISLPCQYINQVITSSCYGNLGDLVAIEQEREAEFNCLHRESNKIKIVSSA